MKKLITILSVLVLIFVVGCKGKRPSRAPGKEEERSKVEEELQREKLDESDRMIRESRASSEDKIDVTPPNLPTPDALQVPKDTSIPAQEITIYQKPPFFKGEVPFKFTVGKWRLYENNYLTLIHNFGDWQNLYIYEDLHRRLIGIADGAKTLDKDGNLVAVAKLSRTLPGEGVEIEEFHLNSKGDVTFYCKSRYSFAFGWKEAETDVKGRKKAEYYLFWPTRF